MRVRVPPDPGVSPLRSDACGLPFPSLLPLPLLFGAGSRGTAAKTDIHHNGMETAKVDDSSIETLWEDGGQSDSINENILQDRKVEDGAPAIAMQLDGRSTREERDAILLGDTSHRQEQEKPLHWVSYIHFGV